MSEPQRPATEPVDLFHRLGERLTAAGNYLGALQQMVEAAPEHDLPRLAELLERALSQFDEAEQLFHRLRHAVGPVPEGQAAGWGYRVCFLNHFARADKTYTVCQRSIVVPSAKSREEAVEAAKKRFAELEGIRDWHLHAGMIEAGLIETGSPATDLSQDPRHAESAAGTECAASGPQARKRRDG